MRWAALTVEVGAAASVEAAEQLFYNSGIKGVAIDDTADPVRITGYLPDDDRLHGQIRAINAALNLLPSLGLDGISENVQLGYIEEADWATAWKKYFKPLRIGKRLVVTPPWEDPALGPDELAIVIDPGMAFGTGSHATTQLCLEAIEETLSPGASMADIGTGSGILSIAAAKLGAACIYAVDIDPLAVRIARDNARVNGVTAEFSETLPRNIRYDIVVANIIADTLIDLAPTLHAILAPTGALIVSGIINSRSADVEQAMIKEGLKPAGGKTNGEWILQKYHDRKD